jgi:MFS family permease
LRGRAPASGESDRTRHEPQQRQFAVALLIDRYGPARIALCSAAIGVLGAALTAVGNPYEIMVAGRFIFGVRRWVSCCGSFSCSAW